MFDRLHDSFLGQRDRPDQPGIPGLADIAASQGWRELPDFPDRPGPHAISSEVRSQVHGIVKSHAGATEYSRVGQTVMKDCYEGSFGGHRTIFGNAWTLVDHNWVVALVIMQVSEHHILPYLHVAPHGRHGLMGLLGGAGGANVSIDPAFDEQFHVRAIPVEAAALLSVPVRQRLLAHPGWRLFTHASTIVCMSFQPFLSATDIAAMLPEVSAIVGAMPVAALPSLEEQTPLARLGFDLSSMLFHGGFDEKDLERQMAAMPPQQRAEVIAAVAAQRERLAAQAAARRAEREARKHHH